MDNGELVIPFLFNIPINRSLGDKGLKTLASQPSIDANILRI